MRTTFCTFLDTIAQNGTISIKPLGKAKNSVSKPMLPGWKDVVTEIVIDKKYAKGLDGIEDYSHVIVVYWMDKEKECHLKHHPQGRKDIPFVGIFACRCPQRPNRIAISTVELVKRKGNVLTVKGLDIVNGTPILDIKPYTPQYDRVGKAKVPDWVGKLVATFFILLFSVRGLPVQAQTIFPTDNHTVREEVEGKAIWEKLQAKQLECKNLTDDNFESLGEYFMGKMVGSSHEVMNNMMVRMIGEEGEKQMHVAMGKRNSGCDTSAAFPEKGTGFMPMMNMMMGGWGSFGLGWLSMLLFWVLFILGVIALLRYLTKFRDNKEGKTPLDILKERYARGEVNKKEFEEIKKDLN